MDYGLETTSPRCIVIGNERYPRRAETVMEHLAGQLGWVGGLVHELQVGKDYRRRYAPESFRGAAVWPHWWAASADHIDAIEDALASGCDMSLIFEDDAHLVPDFEGLIQAAWRAAEPGWKAIRLGWNANKEAGMHGTLWSRAGMIEAYEHFQRNRHKVVDRAFAELRAERPEGWYVTAEPAVITAPRAKQCGLDR